MDRLFKPLQEKIEGEVYTPDFMTDEHRTNYGHIFNATPRFLVRPRSADDVAATVRFARENGLSVATRGAAHSQSRLGISDGGILLDMKSLNRILSVDRGSETADVEAGVIWRDLVHHVMRWDLQPRVLTNNLGVTVGGTLSMAGIGISSFRYGSQGDNVVEMDVVTGAGEIVTCGPERHGDLFWAVIAGLGQCGVITRARLSLRKVKPMTRTYYLLYDDLQRFLDDSLTAMDSGKWDFIESWCAPCPQGTKPVSGRRQVFARWFYPFHATVEFDPGSPPDDAAMLSGLRPYDNLYTDDIPSLDFAERMVPVFDLWRRAGTWEHIHPWMELVMPWATAKDYITQVLVDLPPAVMVGGHVLLWPAKGKVSHSRLFMRPDGENLVGFGILPAVPPRFWDLMRPILESASLLGTAMGGKRYLSGYVDFDQDQWREHYGPMWDYLYSMKKQYDPDGILNRGFVRFGKPGGER